MIGPIPSGHKTADLRIMASQLHNLAVNLGRSKAVRQLIRSVGAKLFFLPKYSPDLNPIEQV